jgi:tetratricopeptide (TPR) repeat protein
MSGSASGGDRLGQLADEFLARYRRGERPALAEYTARHPELADQIDELFPALVMMEEVRPVPQIAAGAGGDPGGAGPPRRLGEYRLVREIGRGGMGVVYEAEQESLGRRVALKVLPPGALGDARHVERFQREARAAARLHHTTIVPVFGVGEEGGTHYYVMQYIEGRPLDQVLAGLRRLRDETGRSAGGATPAVESPPGDAAAGGPSSGEVARSLWQGHFRPGSRPDGARPADPGAAGPGEPPAADPSGLLSDPQRPYAKSVAAIGLQIAEALEYAAGQGVLHRDVKPANLLLDVWGAVWLTDFGLAKATGTPDLTRTGDLLGTLRYLAPERFRGRADVRSDVYALGLTLYEMLALRPAFAARDQAELVRHITTAEAPRLDRVNPDLPRDLVTIVHKAMARDPADRYQTAGALAEDLRRFLDDRGILARRLSLAEQAWRWCRRNPPTAALVAALLGLVLLAAGGGLWLERQQAERRGRSREAIEAALAQVPGLRRQGRWPEARALLDQADSRGDEAGSDGLRRRLGQARLDLELAARLEGIRLRRMTLLDGNQRADREYAAALAEARLAAPGEEEATAAHIRASGIREQLTAALDDWALATPDAELGARLARVARVADPDPAWRDRLRDPAAWRDRAALERLATEAPVAELPPQLLTVLGARLLRARADAEPFLRAAQQSHPTDFWLNFELGLTLTSLKPAEAEGFLRAALVARPDNSQVYDRLGLVLAGQGRQGEALAAYRRAVALDHNNSAAQCNLGAALHDNGQLDEALATCRRATELDPNGAPGHFNLGRCLQDKGRLDEAMAEFRRSLQLDPTGGSAHYQLGNILGAKGRADEAIAEFRKSVRFDPGGAPAHEALADALLGRGRFAEARAAAQRGLDLLPANEPRRRALRQKLEQSERLLALVGQLPALLPGQEPPDDADEQLDLARRCRDRGRPYAATCLYAAAFAARPALADDLAGRHRYDAACAAARAADDPNPDEVRLREPDRAGLRRQALDWLRADLAQITRLPQGGKSVGAELTTWQTDAALAGLRDRASLEKLPDDERRQWQRFWADVDAALAAEPLEQGRAHAARREWGPAADCYARALERDPADEGHRWFEYAAVLLLSGDRPGYARACARLVERCGQAPNLRRYHVARACTLAPDSVADAARPGCLARKELTAYAREFWSLTEQGALHYRAGRFKEAVPLLEQSLRADPLPGRAVMSWLWLAMAEQRLGRAEEARRWLGKAQGWLDQYGNGIPARAEEELGLHLHNWLEAHVLRREAEALLGPAPAALTGK